MIRRPPSCALFPYTTLFRSHGQRAVPQQERQVAAVPVAKTLEAALERRKEDRKSTRSELQSRRDLVCRLLLEKKKKYRFPPLRVQFERRPPWPEDELPHRHP